MLQITILPVEIYDETRNKFLTTKAQVLQLEHSLVSLAKWESQHKKVFLSREPKTIEETIDYIRCMTLTQNVDPNAYYYISQSNMTEVNSYIDDPMTATTFQKNPGGQNSREVVTAEIIYYWMIALNVPIEFQKWHLNRLLTLINVCNIKNKPAKKMRKQDIYAQNAALNNARKAALNTTG